MMAKVPYKFSGFNDIVLILMSVYVGMRVSFQSLFNFFVHFVPLISILFFGYLNYFSENFHSTYRLAYLAQSQISLLIVSLGSIMVPILLFQVFSCLRKEGNRLFSSEWYLRLLIPSISLLLLYQSAIFINQRLAIFFLFYLAFLLLQFSCPAIFHHVHHL